jgi:hypothetical protein
MLAISKSARPIFRNLLAARKRSNSTAAASSSGTTKICAKSFSVRVSI